MGKSLTQNRRGCITPRQSPHDKLDACYHDPGAHRGNELFEILGQTPVSVEPSGSSLNNPPSRQKHEASGGIRAFDDFQGPVIQRRQRFGVNYCCRSTQLFMANLAKRDRAISNRSQELVRRRRTLNAQSCRNTLLGDDGGLVAAPLVMRHFEADWRPRAGYFIMHRPLKVEPLSRTASRTAGSVYFELCKTFLHGSHGSHPSYDYVKSCIANEATLDRHIRSFEIYAPYLASKMRVLDWGCRHAPDSCMMRTLHPTLYLYGCDFTDEGFSVFHNYAQLSFKQLQHEYRLPYEDQSFDAVLASGVLEHVAFEYESTREIWRVLKDGGLLFVTFLPNRMSLTENLSRLIGNYDFCHNRLYDLSQTKNMFLRSGFVVERFGRHQVFPTFAKNMKAGNVWNSVANLGAKLNRVAEKVPIVNVVASNIFFILRRVRQM